MICSLQTGCQYKTKKKNEDDEIPGMKINTDAIHTTDISKLHDYDS